MGFVRFGIQIVQFSVMSKLFSLHNNYITHHTIMLSKTS